MTNSANHVHKVSLTKDVCWDDSRAIINHFARALQSEVLHLTVKIFVTCGHKGEEENGNMECTESKVMVTVLFVLESLPLQLLRQLRTTCQ